MTLHDKTDALLGEGSLAADMIDRKPSAVEGGPFALRRAA